MSDDKTLGEKLVEGLREAVAFERGEISATVRKVLRAGVYCHDCGLAYGDAHGFPDLVVPHDVWEKISPTGDRSGLLCPTCMCKRAFDAGLSNIPARFTSGPFEAPDFTQHDLAMLDEAPRDWDDTEERRAQYRAWHESLASRIAALLPIASLAPINNRRTFMGDEERLAHARIAIEVMLKDTRTVMSSDGTPLYNGAFAEALGRMIREEIRSHAYNNAWWRRLSRAFGFSVGAYNDF